MNLNDLMILNPAFKFFVDLMTVEVKNAYFVKEYHAGQIIHNKYEQLEYFGIVVRGLTRVVNEFENGNIYVIEKNPAIDYIGEVTLLSGKTETSVTIEALTPCTIFFIPRLTAEKWIFSTLDLLTILSRRVAVKLYRKSFHDGMKLYHSSEYILVDYLIKSVQEHPIEKFGTFKLNKPRRIISEEIGMNEKTLNRTIYKLKNENLFSLQNGKIHITMEQFDNALLYLDLNKC